MVWRPFWRVFKEIVRGMGEGEVALVVAVLVAVLLLLTPALLVLRLQAPSSTFAVPMGVTILLKLFGSL